MFPYNRTFDPPCPTVRIRITDTRRGISFLFDAVVDTGCDTTCIPESEGSGKSNVSYDVCTIWEEEREMIRIPTAFVELLNDEGQVVFSAPFADLKLPVFGERMGDDTWGYVGRDVLNNHVSEFNGVSRTWRIE